MTRTELIQRKRITPAQPVAVRGPFRTFGEQLVAVAKAAEFPERAIDPRLLQIRGAAGSSEAVPSEGGFLVQPEFSQNLVNKLYSQGELLSRMTRFETTQEWATGLKLLGFDEQSRADGSRFGGVRACWQNEAETATPTRPKFRLLELNLKKLLGFAYVTDELLSDAGILQQSVELGLTNEFVFKVESASVSGSGAGQLLGILNSGALITVAAEAQQTAASVNEQNVTKMAARLWAPSLGRAVWLANGELRPQLATLALAVGTSGGSQLPLYHYAESEDETDRLMGRPILYAEYAALPGALGDIVLADMSQYAFLEKAGGIDTAISIHVQFASDESVFRFRWRCDGSPMWATAVTPATGTQTLSPYVVLATRT